MLSPFYLSGFAWNLAHGMANMLVPLYALDVGMSGVQIGMLFALPVVLQTVLNLAGGAYVDRFGAKNILYASCCASVIACADYVLSEGFWGLMLGQCLSALSRASFWPASWALGSELPGERSANMGRLNSTTNAGQIVGTAAAGVMISLLGFKASFWVSAAVGLLALLLVWAIRSDAARRPARASGVLATYSRLARMRSIYFAMACAFVSVLPFTIVSSFGAILLVSEGFSSDATGWLLTLRAVGAIFAGLVFAKLVRSALDRRIAIWSCAATAAGFALVAVSDNPWPAGTFLFVLGVASGVLSIYFQLLVSAVSDAAQRGSAMSYGGLGWNVANITAPLLMGAFMDALGIHAAFYLLGALLFAYALGLAPLYRWAFAHGEPAEPR